MATRGKLRKRKPRGKRRAPAPVKGKRHYTTSTSSSRTSIYEVCGDCKHRKYMGEMLSKKLAKRVKKMLETAG